MAAAVAGDCSRPALRALGVVRRYVAMCRFARAYADQTERDHLALVKAVASGRLAAEHGV